MSNQSAYLYVKNWDELQHYKKRNPPWIKLYRRLMTDGQFHMLNEAEQWQLVRIWLVSAEDHPGGYVPNDENWLRRMTGSLRAIPVQKFTEAGWLIPTSASTYASALASTADSTEAEIDPQCLPPEVQRFIKNPTNQPTSTTDVDAAEDGLRLVGIENGLKAFDLQTMLKDIPA